MHTKKDITKFSILCWNVQKRSGNYRFETVMRKILQDHPAQIIALQEGRRKKGSLCRLEGLAYAKMSCNIQAPFGDFGVVTLSTFPGETLRLYRSGVREAGFATRKSALLTRHTLPGGQTLHLLNLHAINFVWHALFEKEIEAIVNMLKEASCTPHLIVAGDFNTWSRKRMDLLEREMEHLGLLRAKLQSAHLVKSIGRRMLDHIYYKGVELKYATAIDVSLSDHNPIYATFELKRDSI
ncbi:endonuclease/exonuclease/phosphatase family protein [Hydrogenimonas sp.]